MAVAPQDQPLLRRLLRTLGVPQKAARELGTLVLRRELSKGPDGVRSKCFVNGSPSSGGCAAEAGHASWCGLQWMLPGYAGCW